MKVPVEVVDETASNENEDLEVQDAAVVEPDEVETTTVSESESDTEDAAHESDDLDSDAEEKARVEAAIRAGEQAAEEELAADAASKLEGAYAQRDELQAKLDAAEAAAQEAKQQAKDAAERVLRVQADWDNFRRRTAQERLDERERAAEKLVVSLLPVLDDMERAIEHARAAAEAETEENQFDQFVAGVDAVHDKMVGILAKEGVEVINPLGEPFNPLEHQAVGRVEDAEAYDETVAAVYQRGYRMGSRVIREAMVQVTFGGPKRPEPESDDSKAAEE